MPAPDIDTLPDAPLITDDPNTFATKASAFVAKMQPWGEDVQAVGDYAGAQADAAEVAKLAAETAEANAETAEANAETAEAGAVVARNAAESFATSVINTANSVGSSTSSNAFSTGAKSFTTQTGKSWVQGVWVHIALTSDPAMYMIGYVTAYNSGTGALDLTVTYENHTGTFASWNIFQTAPIDLVNILEPRNVTAATTFAQADDVNFDTSGGAISQTIPAPTVGQQILLHRMGAANALNLTPASGVTIRGAKATITSADTLIPRDGETLNLVYKTTNVWEAR